MIQDLQKKIAERNKLENDLFVSLRIQELFPQIFEHGKVKLCRKAIGLDRFGNPLKLEAKFVDGKGNEYPVTQEQLRYIHGI